MILVTASACARSKPGVVTVSPIVVLDTALGTVVQVGPDPGSYTALALAGGTQLRLSGAGAGPLGSVTGAQVWVAGARDATGFRVDASEVRMVNDQPVDDGIVVVMPTSVAIRMRGGGQREVPYAPPALRELAGARIWVSRPVAGVAPSYGIIR